MRRRILDPSIKFLSKFFEKLQYEISAKKNGAFKTITFRWVPSSYIPVKFKKHLTYEDLFNGNATKQCRMEEPALMADTKTDCTAGNIEKKAAGSVQKKIKKPETRQSYGKYQNVMLTDVERDALFLEYGEDKSIEAIQFFDEYIEMKGYTCNNHNLALRHWVFTALKERKLKEEKLRRDELRLHAPFSSSIVEEWATAEINPAIFGTTVS